MSLLLLLYGTGETVEAPATPEEEQLIRVFSSGFLPTPKVKRKRKPNDVAYNYTSRLLREDDELLVLLSLMDE